MSKESRSSGGAVPFPRFFSILGYSICYFFVVAGSRERGISHDQKGLVERGENIPWHTSAVLCAAASS
jgi:hypothetical protein